MSDKSIDIRNISKSYGDLKALDDISFSVSKGEIFGLIGPDGAGKTTLFRILATLLNPDSGSASIHGFDVVRDFKKVRNIIGYMPGQFSLYPDLTVEENLHFFASVFEVNPAESIRYIEPIYRQIERFKNRRAGALSGGMKQKLALCCALIHRPEILLLDEPTTGVDAVSRTEFWDILNIYREEGMPVIASTPYMDEASRCSRLALIFEGKILSSGSVDEIIRSHPLDIYEARSENRYQLLSSLRAIPEVENAYLNGEAVRFIPKPGCIDTIRRALTDTEITKVTRNGVEDVFINLLSKRNET